MTAHQELSGVKFSVPALLKMFVLDNGVLMVKFGVKFYVGAMKNLKSANNLEPVWSVLNGNLLYVNVLEFVSSI